VMKTLVAVEMDLASSFAIRYACRLGQHIKMELNPVYVKSPPSMEPTTGVGWAPHTWQRELIQMGKEEIQEMLASEMDSCPVMQEPRVVYGDRGTELLKIVEQEAIDLYVEGAPQHFTSPTIFKTLRSKFYQRLDRPFIWVRTLRKIDQVFVLCRDVAAVRTLVRTLGRMWQGCRLPLHLAFPESGGTSDAGPEALLRREVRRAKVELEAEGCGPLREVPFAPVSGAPPPGLTDEYGLVVLTLERELRKDSPQLKWLSEAKVPLMMMFA
jgi:hypothetical protein